MKIKLCFQCNSSSSSYIFSIGIGIESELLSCLGHKISKENLLDYYGLEVKEDRDYWEISIPYSDGELDEKITRFLEKKGVVLERDWN